jgi:hypothetical protein
VPPCSLEGLDQFSHVWLVFVFHANAVTSAQLRQGHDAHRGTSAEAQLMTTHKPMVKPPKLGVKTGCFASRYVISSFFILFPRLLLTQTLHRSPHRINPVGLSLARLDAVRDGQLWLSGVDLIDGTPVLDIKPYHPADAMPWELTRAPGTSATRIHF